MADKGFSLRSVAPMLVFDAALPWLTYTLLKAQVPDISEVHALGASAVGPAVYGLYGVIIKRHIDIIGSVVLAGIAVSILALFVGGDPKVILVRESFVTGALGAVCLLSLLGPKPLMFYVGRQFTAGQDPEEIAKFDALWQRPGARRVFRILTVVWGVGWVGEFGLRVLMVQLLTVPQVLAIGPLVFNGITFALIAWTVAWTRRRRKLGEQAMAAEAAAEARPQA
ncbi:hypothetical protein HHL11_10420 [Ramlibacter sp. G-1-2-2]|uniref:DUF3159 domain-containing protein n=1 Tax=Ramlibacter agri TaxID=2728837 RepID=A0A848H024_9BURK|nr:VC0807 family protein [Ramlibacter agri]NML44165.1 hypothetical protein [Ramlibacter agri]